MKFVIPSLRKHLKKQQYIDFLVIDPLHVPICDSKKSNLSVIFQMKSNRMDTLMAEIAIQNEYICAFEIGI